MHGPLHNRWWVRRVYSEGRVCLVLLLAKGRRGCETDLCRCYSTLSSGCSDLLAVSWRLDSGRLRQHRNGCICIDSMGEPSTDILSSLVTVSISWCRVINTVAYAESVQPVSFWALHRVNQQMILVHYHTHHITISRIFIYPARYVLYASGRCFDDASRILLTHSWFLLDLLGFLSYFDLFLSVYFEYILNISQKKHRHQY